MSSKHVMLYQGFHAQLSDAVNHAVWLACDNPSSPIPDLQVNSASFDPRIIRQKLVREAVDVLSIMRVTPGVGTDVRIAGEDIKAVFTFTDEVCFNLRDPLVRYCLKLIQSVGNCIDRTPVLVNSETVNMPNVNTARRASRTRTPLAHLELRGTGSYFWNSTDDNDRDELLTSLFRTVLEEFGAWNHGVAGEETKAFFQGLVGKVLGAMGVNKHPATAMYRDLPAYKNLDIRAFIHAIKLNGVALVSKKCPELRSIALQEGWTDLLEMPKISGVTLILSTSRFKGFRTANAINSNTEGINILQNGSRGAMSDLASSFSELDVVLQMIQFVPDMPKVLERISRSILRRVLSILDSKVVETQVEPITEEDLAREVTVAEDGTVTPVEMNTDSDTVQLATVELDEQILQGA